MNFLLKYSLKPFYKNKRLLLTLRLVLKELDANKKCQVSLAVKYIKLFTEESIILYSEKKHEGHWN